MLGITQIIAWGTIFYSPVLTVPLIVRETGWSLSFGMGGFSLGLLVAGLVSPFIGRSIDRYGGHVVMSAGALVAAAGLAGLSQARDPWTYLAVWMVLGVGLGGSLYDPAFATLGRIFGAAARRPITFLTLAGGFASTAGWPTTHVLIETVGWRGTYLVYAALMALVCAPLYLFALPRSRASLDAPQGSGAAPPPALLPPRGIAFVLVTAAFTAYAFVPSGLSAHLLAIFDRAGIDATTVVFIGALFGPAQVAARVVELAFGHNVHPLYGRARRGGAAGRGIRAARGIRNFGAARHGLCRDVRRRQRPRHHHPRRAAAGAVRRRRLWRADGPHLGLLAGDAVGGAAGDGVRRRARIGQDRARACRGIRDCRSRVLRRDQAAELASGSGEQSNIVSMSP